MISVVPTPDAVAPQYQELELDPATGDLAFPIAWIYGAFAVAQRVQCRLRFVRGEWYLDQRLGLPLQRILGKHDMGEVTSIIRATVADTPGVLSVDDVSVFVSSAAEREIAVSFRATVAGGTLIAAKETLAR